MLTSTMPAVRWHGPLDVRLEQVPVPEEPGPGMALVQVSCCGICGTDVSEYRHGPFLIRPGPHPLTGQAPPVTLGHEFAGAVVAVGAGVDVAVGTRVTADACWRCGACPACMRGDYHLCRYGGSIGLSSDGAFAPLVTVPAYALVELPPSVSAEQAAMAEPLAVGLHALDRGSLRAADDLLVLGFGPIGAAAALVGRALGANPAVVDASAARLEVASRLGFEVLEAGRDLPRRLRTSIGRLGVDLVLECTGAPAVLPDAMACADRGGRIVLVGLANGDISIDTTGLALYERSLVGSLGYCRDLPRVVSLMASGALDPSPLIAETIELAEVPAMLQQLATDPGERIKVLASA